MKLHRDLGVSQPTAWFMLHRIRQAWSKSDNGTPLSGPVEIDETYVGGRRRNMPRSKRKELAGRGPVGKVTVVGAKDRATNRIHAEVVPNATRETMSRFIMEHVEHGARIFTDDSTSYTHLPNHESVNHSAAEYVRGQVHTQGIESFWSTLKRAHKGVFHKLSPKHLDRYVREFAGKHNLRQDDTADQMRQIVVNLIGKRLAYRDLIADNGLPSGARS
jgi:transposase-like protein